MVTRIFEDCSTVTGWTEQDHAGTSNYTSVSNEIKWLEGGVGAERASLYKSVSLSGSWEMVYVFKAAVYSTDVANKYISAYVSEGTTYILFGVFFTGSSESWVIRSHTSRDIVGAGGAADALKSVSLTLTNYTWIRIVFDGTDNFTFFYNSSNSKNRPTSWTQDTDMTVTKSFGNISEYGFHSHSNTATSYEYRYDNFQILTNPSVPLNNSVINGTTIKLSNIYTRNTVGKMGAVAILGIHDPLWANHATLETSHNTVATVYDTVFYNRHFQGEIKEYNSQRHEVTARGIDQKLERTRCNYDPRILVGTIEMMGPSNTMYKRDTGPEAIGTFATLGVSANQMVGFIKQDYRRYVGHPTTITIRDNSDISYTPNLANEGGIPQLFFSLNADHTDAERFWHSWDNAQDAMRAEMIFTNIIRDGSTIAKINCKFEFKVSYSKTSNDAPSLVIYDYTNTQFRSLVKDGKIIRPSGDLQTIEFTLPDALSTGSLTDYYTESAANTYSFVTQTFKFQIRTQTNPPLSSMNIKVGLAQMEYILLTDQIQELMIGKILTVNNHNLVFYDDASLTWASEDVRDDGVCAGDTFIVSDNISDIFTTVMTNSGLSSILNLNFAPTIEYPETEDLRFTMFSEFLARWEEHVNASWNIDYTNDPANDLPTLNFLGTSDITDTTDGDGNALVLTDADIEDWSKLANHRSDSINEVTTIIVVGKNGISYSATNTIEHSNDLGAETIVIKKPELETYRQVKEYAEGAQKAWQDADRELTFRIPLDNANQDYSNIKVNQWIQVKLPADGSVYNYTTGNDGKLFIYQTEYIRVYKKGWKNYQTIMCRKRVT